MNQDFRISTGFFDHHKTIKLEEACGQRAVIALLKLWRFAATTRIDGDLSGISANRLEQISDWPGRRGALISALTEIGFLDKRGDNYAIHDWTFWNSYCASAEARIAKAKHAAHTRWLKETVTQLEVAN